MFRKILIALVGALALAAAPGCGPDPQDDRAIESVKLYKQGVEKYNQGKVDAGIDDLRKARELQPDYRKLRYDLGVMLLRRADVLEDASLEVSAEAKKLHDEGKLDEEKAKNEDALRIYQNSVYDAREALAELSWVESAGYPDKLIYFHLSKVNTHLGEYKAARQWLEKYMEEGELGPADRDLLAKVRARLVEREVAKEREKKETRP